MLELKFFFKKKINLINNLPDLYVQMKVECKCDAHPATFSLAPMSNQKNKTCLLEKTNN